MLSRTDARNPAQDVGIQELLNVWLLGRLRSELGREFEDAVARRVGEER